MSNFLIFKAAFNNSATPAIGTYTAEGATAQFNNGPDVSPDYYLYNTAAGSTAVQWFVPTKETTDFEFVADILTDDQSLDGDRYFIIADSTGTTGLCMLSSSSITEWRFMNGDGTATSDPEYVGAIDPATSGGFGVFHRFRVRVRKLTASSSSVEVYVDGALKLTAIAGAALVTCAKIGFIGGVTGSPSTDSGIKNAYVYDLSGGDVITRGVLSEAFNRFINWTKGIFETIEEQGNDPSPNNYNYYIRYSSGLQICWGYVSAGNQTTKTFLKSFSIRPSVSVTVDSTDPGSRATATCTAQAVTVYNNLNYYGSFYIAIGRWK